MKATLSAVSTTIALLPPKLVSQAILGSETTMSASTDAAVMAWRIDACLRLRISVGACGMNGLQPALERGKRRGCACAPRVGFALSVGKRMADVGEDAFQIRVVGRELQRRRIVGERGSQLSLPAAGLRERACG